MSKNDKSRRIDSGLVVAALVVLFSGAVATQVGTQVLRKDEILSHAKTNREDLKGKALPAQRGDISTRDGHVLAQNEDSYTLCLSYSHCPQTNGFFMAVSKATGISVAELSYGAQNKKYGMWATRLSTSQLDQIAKLQKEWRADGLVATPIASRKYPLGEQFSSIVGVVRSGKPISGIEYGFNDVLSGQDGVEYSNARYASFDPPAPKDAINGRSMGLTIDSTLQTLAYDAVKGCVEKHKATRGCAIVIDPHTGDVLSMASFPSYDPDASLKPENMSSAAYQAALEPGSMFKILTLAEALDKGAISAGWSTTCAGELAIDNQHSVKCDDHHGNRAHGAVDITKAIAVSCNTSAAKWALALGRSRMTEYLKQLGLVGKPGTRLPGEAAGGFDANDASRLQLANFGFGQAMVASPLALASAFSMIGNGGVLMKPRIVKSLDGQEVATEARGQIVKKSTAETVLHTMEAVIQSDYGTGADLKIPGFRLAGKTGTAQKIKHGKVVGYVSNFVGFVPANNPKACVLVMIDDPKAGGYYGAAVAGPVFRDIAKAILRKSEVDLESQPAINYASLAPGLEKPVVIPASFPVKKQVQEQDKNEPSVEVVRPAAKKKAQQEESSTQSPDKVKKKRLNRDTVNGKFDPEVPRGDEVDVLTEKQKAKRGTKALAVVKQTPHPTKLAGVKTETAATASAMKVRGLTTQLQPAKTTKPTSIKRKTAKTKLTAEQMMMLLEMSARTPAKRTKKLVKPPVHPGSATETFGAQQRIQSPKRTASVGSQAQKPQTESESVTVSSPQRIVRKRPVRKVISPIMPRSGKMGGAKTHSETETIPPAPMRAKASVAARTVAKAKVAVKSAVKKVLKKKTSPKMALPKTN